MTEEEREDRLRKRAALLLLPLLLLGAGCCFWSFFANVAAGEAVSFIAAPLGSQALANYGEDEIPGRLRSLSISIVEAVIRDRDPEGEDADARATEVIESLKSPVPTITPKPGDPTTTPTSMPTTIFTPDPLVTPTETLPPSPSPFPSRTPTPTKTDEPTTAPTSGPSPTPSKTPIPATPTPTPLCSATPYVKIMTPAAGQHFTFADDLPGQAFAFDPDNVDPVACSTATAIFPDDDGEGLEKDAFGHEVEMRIEWWNGSGWSPMYTELESNDAYCPFGDADPFCLSLDLSTGEWPNSTPINTGKHRLWAQALRDDEAPPEVPSAPHWHEFHIDPSVITVEDISSSEGSDLTFTVTLDIEVPSAFTVDVTLTNVTATGGAAPLMWPKDYDNVVASLNFSGNSGETQQFTVETYDDFVLEGAETFTVSLNASSSYVTDTDTATGTINDNDSATVTVNDATETEGTSMLFTVTLDNEVQGAFDVNVSLVDVTATGGSPLVSPKDYDNFVSPLNFTGTAGETLQFTVATLDDASFEGTETFTVALSATNAWVTDSDTGTGTIIDNESCPDLSIIGSGDDDDKEVWFDVDNTESVPVAIDRIVMDWNGSGNMEWIKLNGTPIWTTSLSDPVDISGGWEASTDISPSPSVELRFRFTSTVSEVYSVTVYSNNGCTTPTFDHDAD